MHRPECDTMSSRADSAARMGMGLELRQRLSLSVAAYRKRARKLYKKISGSRIKYEPRPRTSAGPIGTAHERIDTPEDGHMSR
eukprot:1311456-Rhodomonas_salina.5